jgi:hypothetical protein
MKSTLFTELTPSEQANLSGGASNFSLSNRSLVQQQAARNRQDNILSFGGNQSNTQTQNANGNIVGNG